MPKFIKYLSYILIALSFVLGVAFYINQDAMTEVLITYGYVLLALAAVSAIVLPLLRLLSNPKGLKSILVKLVIVVVICGLSYALASTDPVKVLIEPAPTAETLKLTDAGLIMTYFLAFASIAAIVFGGIINLVRNR